MSRAVIHDMPMEHSFMVKLPEPLYRAIEIMQERLVLRYRCNPSTVNRSVLVRELLREGLNTFPDPATERPLMADLPEATLRSELADRDLEVRYSGDFL